MIVGFKSNCLFYMLVQGIEKSPFNAKMPWDGRSFLLDTSKNLEKRNNYADQNASANDTSYTLIITVVKEL